MVGRIRGWIWVWAVAAAGCHPPAEVVEPAGGAASPSALGETADGLEDAGVRGADNETAEAADETVENPLIAREPIEFEGRDTILSTSHERLDRVAELILAHPQWGTIEIQCHRSRGPDLHGHEITQLRAESVARYLIERGVDAGRLLARGYGDAVPIEHYEGHATEEERQAASAANERVDFVRTSPSP